MLVDYGVSPQGGLSYKILHTSGNRFSPTHSIGCLPCICGFLRFSLADGSSNPHSSTICKTPTRLSWGFFLGDRACCPVFLRVHAETCGPRPLHYQTGSAPGSLSSGHFSLYPWRAETGRSPQDPRIRVNKLNDLRVDESNGFIHALAGERKSQLSGLGCGGLRKAGAGHKFQSVISEQI